MPLIQSPVLPPNRYITEYLEISQYTITTRSQIFHLLIQTLAQELPILPPNKTFTPKFKLTKLASYNSTAPDSFWQNFPQNLNQPATSLVNPTILRKLAVATEYPDTNLLNKICEDLATGANIGCSGTARLPSFSSNATSAHEFGPHVTDAIADWITKGFAYGPIPLDKIPADAKVNGIMTKQKPNGSVRIILNLSAPLGQAVNEGIDNAQFPTKMSSTTKFLKALHLAGRNAKICKIDWADAYKHLAVRTQDTDLQWFVWLGKAFKELCLIFGCTSSAGLFDRLAKVVVHIVIHKSNFPSNQVCHHLDDCCAAANFNSDILELFDATFSDIARQLGIKLAPRLDPEKSFGPCQKGLVLGIVYDTVQWTWALNHEKLARLLQDLKAFLDASEMAQSKIWSMVGKIIHIRPLIPDGRFNIHHLLKANSLSTNKNHMIHLTPGFKRQTWFWFTMIRLCSGRGKLPNPNITSPPWATNVYTDAAGGSMSSVGLGAGAVAPNWWAYVPWSKAINLGKPTPTGTSLNRAMSALELVGPLLAVSSGFSWCKNQHVVIWVDNAASVYIWNKGYSTSCPLSTTLVNAIACVCAALGCSLNISKILRCSTPEAILADALSKADFNMFWNLTLQHQLPMPVEQAWVPPHLLQWVHNPIADDYLGNKILKDISKRALVLGYNC